jgi:uncharacterized protein (TIGR02328 family)
MRLWHQQLIPLLPRQQLLGQHRECCALRGKGWGKKHSTINYIFNYSYYHLYLYHYKIMLEMIKRKYIPDNIWFNHQYRGKKITFDFSDFTKKQNSSFIIYPEHNNDYLQECIKNLSNKGINISEGIK